MWLNICFYSDKMVTSVKDGEGVETGGWKSDEFRQLGRGGQIL